MQIEEILKEAKPTPMGDGNLYRMVINERLNLHIRTFTDSPLFFLYAKVGELPEGPHRQELLEELLEANLFCQGSGNGFFSWHRETNTLVLMVSFDSTVATEQQYQARLQTFVDFLIHWQKKFKQAPEKGKSEDILKLMSQKKRIFFI